MIRHLLIVLVIGAACYGAVTWIYRQLDDGFVQLSRPESAGESSTEGPATPSVGSTDAARDPAGDGPVDIGVITRRNIFLSPGVAPAGEDGSGGSRGGEPDLLLIGTVLQSDGKNRAVLYEVEEKRQLLLTEGDAVNGATVTRIMPGRVVISRRGRSETLAQADAAEYRRGRLPGPGGQSGLTGSTDTGIPVAEPATALQPAGAVDGTGGDGGPGEQGRRLEVDPEAFGTERGGMIIKGRITK